MNGKLSITNIGGPAFANGDAFKIINGTVVGTPTEITPANPGPGLAWDLSEFNTAGKIKVIPATGLNDNVIINRIYPNPFKNKIQISLGQFLNDAQVSVVNVLGQTVYTNNFGNTNQINLNLDKLETGVYMLQIKNGDDLISTKIVKE